jgi:hypothetical protein
MVKNASTFIHKMPYPINKGVSMKMKGKINIIIFGYAAIFSHSYELYYHTIHLETLNI